MKKIVLLIVLTLIYFGLNAQFNCYTIVVGKNVSTTGKVILAHNEDDAGDLVVNIFKVPAQDYGKNHYYKLINGDSLVFARQTYSYLWFETTTQNFGDFYINQYGVSICSNACPSKEGEYENNYNGNNSKVIHGRKQIVGILTYDFRRMIAMRAKSSRQAVQIAAALIDSLGYGSSGRTYTFADANEAWIFAVVRGKNYIAQRLDDNQVAIIPNFYTIEKIDTNDNSNFVYSPNLIKYAIDSRWYHPQKDGDFNFRLVYSDSSSLKSIGNIPRFWMGLNMLANQSFDIIADFPFSFVPKEKVGFEQIKNVLSSHFEGTIFEKSKDLSNDIHESMVHPICNNTTVFSFYIDYNGNDNNKNIVWFAFNNPCMNPFLPLVFNIDSLPPNYANCKWNEAVAKHFEQNANSLKYNTLLAYTLANNNTKKIKADYSNKINKVLKDKAKFEAMTQKMIKNKPDGKTSYNILKKEYKLLLKTRKVEPEESN